MRGMGDDTALIGRERLECSPRPKCRRDWPEAGRRTEEDISSLCVCTDKHKTGMKEYGKKGRNKERKQHVALNRQMKLKGKLNEGKMDENK
jgi:hypothetical protein